eukprot:scaffold41189_cov45-Phaeocystis_antarctica.AAC.1
MEVVKVRDEAAQDEQAGTGCAVAARQVPRARLGLATKFHAPGAEARTSSKSASTFALDRAHLSRMGPITRHCGTCVKLIGGWISPQSAEVFDPRVNM